MKIDKISIENFGKLKNFDIELQDGLNIIYGKNESGKTTILQFIKAMLYGFSNNKRTVGENYRKKYNPWGEAKSSGSLYLQDTDSFYRIQRTFGEKKSEDKLEIINNQSGEMINLQGSMQPGQVFFGIEASTYEKTLFISQFSSKISEANNDEIIENLSNLKNSGDSEVSYERAIKQLEAYKKSIKNTNKTPGKLDKLEKEYNEYFEKQIILRNRKMSWENKKHEDVQTIFSEIYEMEEFKSPMNKEDLDWIKNNVAKLKGTYEIYEEKAMEDQKTKEEYQDLLNEANFFSLDPIQAANELNIIVEKGVLIDTYREKEEILCRLKAEIKLLEKNKKALQDSFHKEEFQQDRHYLKQLEDKEEKYQEEEFALRGREKDKQSMPPKAIGAIMAIGLLIPFAVIFSDFSPIAMGLGALAFFLILWILKKKTKENTRQIRDKLMSIEAALEETGRAIEKIYNKYGIQDRDEFINKFYNMQSQLDEMGTMIQEKELQSRNYTSIDYTKLLAENRDWIHQTLSKYDCHTKEELKEKIQLFHETHHRRLKLQELIKHGELTRGKLKKTMDEIHFQLIAYIDKFYDKTLIEITDNIEGLKGKISVFNKELSAVEKAIEVLEKSFYKFHMSFSANLNEKAREILKRITGKNYNQILVSKDFDVKIADSDKNEVRSIDYFSNGTWDQIYFSIRMGIYELLRDKINKSLPLLLDDAFVQYDGERMRRVLDYILDYGDKNQVVLFTCQKREIDYLKEKRGIQINILDIS